MADDLVNIDKLKQIFSQSTGERTIEVTEEEYQRLYGEALENDLEIQRADSRFTLKLNDLTINIVCDDEEEE